MKEAVPQPPFLFFYDSHNVAQYFDGEKIERGIGGGYYNSEKGPDQHLAFEYNLH